MGSLAISDDSFDKYFGYLKSLDTNSKKRLIIKLTESIETKASNSADVRNLFGSWEDDKDSDNIIRELRDSRVNNNNMESF